VWKHSAALIYIIKIFSLKKVTKNLSHSSKKYTRTRLLNFIASYDKNIDKFWSSQKAYCNALHSLYINYYIYKNNINNYITKYTTLEYICILATQDTSQIRYY